MEDATFVAFRLWPCWQSGSQRQARERQRHKRQQTYQERQWTWEMHGKHLTYNKVEQQGTNLALLLFLSNVWIMLECWIHAGRGILAECCGLVESPPIQVVEWAEEERIYRICIAETCPCITCFFTENERTPMYCSCIVVYCSPCPKTGILAFISGCDKRLGCKTELMVFAWRFVPSRSCCGGFQGLKTEESDSIGTGYGSCSRGLIAETPQMQKFNMHVNDLYYIYTLHTHTPLFILRVYLSFVMSMYHISIWMLSTANQVIILWHLWYFTSRISPAGH